jgi:hypothetical protein
MEGPHYLGILKYLDIPAAVLMAAEKHQVTITVNAKSKERAMLHKLEDLGNTFPDFRLKVVEKD